MSMMSFSDLLRRKDSSLDKENLDPDDAFAQDIEAALEIETGEGFVDDAPSIEDESLHAVAEDDEEEPDFSVSDVLTPHAQGLMADFSAFDDANASTREELANIGKAFSHIVGNFNVGREFIERCRQEIQRASDLEHANHRLVIENRRLVDRAQKDEQFRERVEDALEAAKRRETRLIQDCESLRLNVSDLRLETIELRNTNNSSEHARTELHMSLSAKTAELERLSREIDLLRDQKARMTVEMDSAQRRNAEARSLLQDLHAIHTVESGRVAELTDRVATAERETQRLQKQLDAAEANAKEANLSLQAAEHEIWERDRRHQSERQAQRAEIDQLSGRLQGYSANLRDISDEQDVDAEVPVIPLRQRQASKSKSRRDHEASAAAAE